MFHLFPVSKKFMHERGISRTSVGVLLTHSIQKFRMGTYSSFRKTLVSKKFSDRMGENRE